MVSYYSLSILGHFTADVSFYIPLTLTCGCVLNFFSIVQLNRVVTGPRNPGVIGDRSGSFSRESE